MKKRICAIILTIVLIVSMFSIISTTALDSSIVGDVDEDIKITVSDVTSIQQFLANIISLSERQKLLGDVDNDNSLTILDATMIQQFLAHIIDKFKRQDIEPTEVTTESETIMPENPYINEYGLAKDMKHGTIFHAWCWNFNTIKENLNDLAAAGFTSIQTSPISQCKVGEDGGMQIYGKGKWYYHYQPTKFVIGNYQLGTKEEFMSMCNEAHKLGMNIIVDAVINHCSSDYSVIDSSVKNIVGGAFHDHNIYWSQENRYHETQGCIDNLYDLKTQNPNVQKMLKDYLTSCVNAGADGFRYDTAKLIELPDDSPSKEGDFSSNCWNVVLDNGAKFQYGENLQDAEDASVCRLKDYSKIMNVTSSLYGERIRNAVNTDNLSVNYIKDYLSEGVDPSKLVTWVESHDNYCNNNSWSYIDEQESIQAWAIIAARQGGTPLYFSRPMNSTSENPWGDNIIGVKGSNLFKDKQIISVNFFRNEMGDLPETLSNPTSSSKVLMIERGNKGAVIVNADSKDISLSNCTSKLQNGIYKDLVSGSTFTVNNGKISGSINKNKVAVIYNSVATPRNMKSSVALSVASSNFYSDSIDVECIINNANNASYSIDGSQYIKCNDGDVITLGENLNDKESTTIKLKASGANGEISTSATYTKKTDARTIVYFDKQSNPSWNNVYVYAYGSNGDNASWPGVKMTDIGHYKYRYVLPDKLASSANIIFNDGASNQVPASGEEGFKINCHEKKMLNLNSVWEDYPLKTIYFKNTQNWNNVHCYFWGSEMSEWPGFIAPKIAGSGTSAIYCMTLFGDDTSVIFSNGSTYQTVDIETFEDGDMFIPSSTYITEGGQRKYSGTITKYKY